MKTIITYLAAWIFSAISFPLMLVLKRVKPTPPPPERIVWEADRPVSHNLVNFLVESVRADSQWWTKAISFILLAELILLGLALIS